MASLVLKMSVSLDGYVAPPDGSADWIAAGGSADGRGWTVDTVSNAGVHLIGAATYTAWAGYWPSASGPFAKAMRKPGGNGPERRSHAFVQENSHSSHPERTRGAVRTPRLRHANGVRAIPQCHHGNGDGPLPGVPGYD